MERRREISSDEGTRVHPAFTEPFTAVALAVKPVGVVFGQAGTLARRLSVQSAATVSNRTNMCQVIIRNTHKPQDSRDSRDPSAALINGSESLLTTRKTVILTPKSSKRIRLEYALGDIWTRDKLPCSGVTTSWSGQVIRASAGSLVHKLSLASMHGTFARRSMSLTTANQRRSNETPQVVRIEAAIGHPKYSMMDETKALNETEETNAERKDEAPPERRSLTDDNRLVRRGTKKLRRMFMASLDVPIAVEEASSGQVVVEEKLGGRKRRSNPLGF